MSYTRTTWQPGRAGGTEFTAARMNNIEQGLVDLFAYKGAKKKLDFNATTWDLTGLDGNAHKGYDITIWGIYGATSPENAPYLTTLTPLTNYTKSAAIENAVDGAGTASGTLTDTSRINTGVFLGATVDASLARNIGILKLSVGAATPSSGNNDYPVMGQSLWRPVVRPAGTPAHRMVLIGGFLEAPAGNLTALRFNWDNAALAGSILVEPWVGSF
jgi:hypothetical protein